MGGGPGQEEVFIMFYSFGDVDGGVVFLLTEERLELYLLLTCGASKRK